jgi:hypothetical protein
MTQVRASPEVLGNPGENSGLFRIANRLQRELQTSREILSFDDAVVCRSQAG